MIAAALLLAAGQGCTPEHAAMGHCELPAAAPPATTAPAVPPAAPPVAASPAPPPAAPLVDAADAVWGADAMRRSRENLYREHGGGRFSQLMIDLAERQVRKGGDGWRWDGAMWWGGDRDRLVVESQGEAGDRVEAAEVQALYSRAIGPYFNLQAGLRHDIAPNPSRTHAVLGVEGLAPYWFDVEAALFLSDRGRVSGRVESYYDQRITQRLILQPRAELNFALSGDRAVGEGSGPTDIELGLRLRYEVVREFAPYIGVNWERRLGGTARIARAGGDDASTTAVVLGVRAWF